VGEKSSWKLHVLVQIHEIAQRLGPFACSVIPFLQTMVVLVNSILLVCIALDRYMAIVRIVKGTWEPTKVFCVSCCVLIWGFSAGVSSPLLSIYDFYKVYVVPVPNPLEESPKLTYYVAYICASDKVN
jgi:7 transmembrane receptor (rhodopsin family)